MTSFLSFARIAESRVARSLNHSLLLALVPVLVASRLGAAEDAKPEAQPVKVLTVGNSFADDACALLPDLAKAGGKDLFLVRANLGGHSLAQHVGYLQAYEANADDPKGSRMPCLPTSRRPTRRRSISRPS